MISELSQELLEYISPELLILIPALYIVGLALKKTHRIKDEYIPLSLGIVSILLCCLHVVATSAVSGWRSVIMALFTGIVQGILCAGACVFTHQTIKQTLKAGQNDDETPPKEKSA